MKRESQMEDKDKTKNQLLVDLAILRKKIRSIESSELELQRTYEETKKTENYLNKAADASIDCIVVSDSKGVITDANKAFFDLLGLPKKEVIGNMVASFAVTEEQTYESTTGEQVHIGREFFDRTRDNISTLFTEGKIRNWVSYYLRNDKKVVPVDMNIVLLYDDDFELTGSVGVIRDITEHKINQLLIEKAHRAEKLSAIAEIAGAAAHELNQPLTSVMASAAMLRRVGDNESERSRLLDAIENESDRMASIIRKLSKVTKYQTKKYVGEAKIVDLEGASDDESEGKNGDR